MERYTGILGILVLLGIAYLLSNNRKAIKPRIILWGISLQLLFGIFILKTKLGNNIFSWFDKVIKKLLDFSLEGSQFLFGNLARQEYFIRPEEAPTNPNDFPFWETWPGFGFQFAFYVFLIKKSTSHYDLPILYSEFICEINNQFIIKLNQEIYPKVFFYIHSFFLCPKQIICTHPSHRQEKLYVHIHLYHL